MIEHVVMLGLKDASDLSDCRDVMEGLERLTGEIPGFLSLTHGVNIDMEGKSPGYPYGFIGRFEDRDALARYAADPRHLVLAARLVALCGGADRITVYDIERD
ncbi:Dabb family protein [Nioella ostreopsis]|uniref:Dabb family protein n=1 Tax=Nioella ostreopsis TaxID=2448479 RepID=UPI000FDAB67D|nr:Dabb family protein [Nioella ostreopsis]